jgi:hypothetical protein
MTEKQEIRAKSAELAIRLLNVAIGTQSADTHRLIPKFLQADEAQMYFDAVTDLAGKFETFISDVPMSI